MLHFTASYKFAAGIGLLSEVGHCLLWTQLCSPQNVCAEALTPDVTVFGDRVRQEVTQVR